MAHDQEPQVTVLPPNKAKIKKLWTVALILLVITICEFIVAFTLHHGPLKTSIFVVMTIVKAAYIVGEFMHLRYEDKKVHLPFSGPVATGIDLSFFEEVRQK